MRTEQYSLCLATRNSLINLARILPVESFLLFNTFYYGNFYMYTKVIGQYNKCSQTYNLARTMIIIFVFFWVLFFILTSVSSTGPDTLEAVSKYLWNKWMNKYKWVNSVSVLCRDAKIKQKVHCHPRGIYRLVDWSRRKVTEEIGPHKQVVWISMPLP